MFQTNDDLKSILSDITEKTAMRADGIIPTKRRKCISPPRKIKLIITVIDNRSSRFNKYLKLSGKFGQGAKMYPTRMNGYGYDKTTEFFRQV